VVVRAFSAEAARVCTVVAKMALLEEITAAVDRVELTTAMVVPVLVAW